MDQVAGDLQNGQACSQCGAYFTEAHGYPVLCHDCYSDLCGSHGSSDLPLATEEEV